MNDDSLPPSPVTSLERLAAEQHELFSAWVTQGFTRAEALELLKHTQTMAAMLTAAQQAQGGDGE